MKKCLVCDCKKLIKKEDNTKPCVNSMNGEGRSTLIHEYNYSCYECLDNMQKEREKQLRDIYDENAVALCKMKIAGFIERELVVPSCSHT